MRLLKGLDYDMINPVLVQHTEIPSNAGLSL